MPRRPGVSALLRALTARPIERIPMDQLTLELTDPNPTDYAMALHSWSEGRGRLPAQCSTIQDGGRCRFTSTHAGPCDPTSPPPANQRRAVWRILWTDNHGRPRVCQVRRDLAPSHRDALEILSTAWSYQIRSVDDVSESYAP